MTATRLSSRSSSTFNRARGDWYRDHQNRDLGPLRCTCACLRSGASGSHDAAAGPWRPAGGRCRPGGSNQADELFGPLGYAVEYERRAGEYRADPGIAVASLGSRSTLAGASDVIVTARVRSTGTGP